MYLILLFMFPIVLPNDITNSITTFSNNTLKLPLKIIILEAVLVQQAMT